MNHKKIMIVEDDSNIQELIRYNLAKEGYNCISLTDGKDVIDTLNRDNPDLVLLDIMLPDSDGMEICKSIRHSEKHDIPVIMVTAKQEESDMVLGYECGADDYVTKPFSPRVLAKKISRLIGKAPAKKDHRVAKDADNRRNMFVRIE